MANEEQLAILKQGDDIWNKWRFKNKGVAVDLSRADLAKFKLGQSNLSKADLREANLHEAEFINGRLNKACLRGAILSQAYLAGARLRDADLRGAILHRTYLPNANLGNVNLSKADVRETVLMGSNLRKANLSQANFSMADLGLANISETNLMGTDLRGADLMKTNLNEAILIGSNFSEAKIGYTIFGNSDLSEAIGLQNVVHQGPSTIGINTITKSMGKIPEIFLRGCGLSDWEIEETKLYNPNLSNDQINKILYKIYDLRATQALQISPLFISYSRIDGTFVDKLESLLNRNGVRFWRDVHDMKAGRMETQIDRAIRQNPTVLLVLSEHSLKSDWVEHEVHTARGLEKEIERDVLCPVALDDSWKSSRWPKRIMEQIMEYNILDFSQWQDDSRFDGMFRKLIDGLELFYKS